MAWASMEVSRYKQPSDFCGVCRLATFSTRCERGSCKWFI